MKNVFIKYWWLFTAIIILPFLLNFLLLIPRFTVIVGNESKWLSFWGSYLGAVISAGVAFIILFKQLEQNHKENEKNRTLQIQTTKVQQHYQWYNTLCECAAEYVYSFQVNEIIKLQNMIVLHNPYEDIMAQFYNLMKTSSTSSMKMVFKGYNNEIDTDEYDKDCEKYEDYYSDIILDIQTLYLYQRNNTEPSIMEFINTKLGTIKNSKIKQFIETHIATKNEESDFAIYIQTIINIMIAPMSSMGDSIYNQTKKMLKLRKQQIDTMLITEYTTPNNGTK